MCTLIQKRPFQSGNLNSEMPGISKNMFLHWGDVSVVRNVEISWFSITWQLADAHVMPNHWC